MYDGHLKNIQHLYLYGKATEARLLEVEEDEECDCDHALIDDTNA